MLFLDYMLAHQNNRLDDLTLKLATATDSIKFLSNQQSRLTPSVTGTPAAQVVSNNNSCPSSCMTAINNAIANIKKPVGTTTVVNKTTTVSNKGEYIIPLGSGTVNELNTWVNAYTAQGTFDTANYSGIKAFYFEVVMHIPNADGEMRAKLIDDSTPFSYDGQVLTTKSGTGQLLSVQMPLISGNKSYHVQLYTTISSGVLDSARIRIVTQ